MRVDSNTNRFMTGVSMPGSKTLVVDSVWHQPGTENTIARAAHSASVSPMRPIDKLLRAHFADANTRTMAIKYYRATNCSGAAWHHGNHYTVSIKGAPVAVLTHCDLSQTMREQLLLEAARRTTPSREVIALASGLSDTLPRSLNTVRQLNFVGFVIVRSPIA